MQTLRGPLLIWAICGLIWLAAGATLPGFASLAHMRYVLELAAMLGIVAAGQTVVIVTGGIDLSVGAVVTVAAIAGPALSEALGDSGPGSVALLLALTAAIGACNGAGVAWLRIHPMIMTLATATILTGALLLLSAGTAVSVRNPAVLFLANGRVAGVSVSILVWALVAAASIFLLRRTVIGMGAHAVGSSPRASLLSGVGERLVYVVAYALSGFTAGLAGVLLSGTTMQGYIGIGDPYLLLSIAAVVVGGTSILGGQGGYGGTIAGTLLLTTITSLITVINVSQGIRNVVLGLLVLALLTVYAREEAR